MILNNKATEVSGAARLHCLTEKVRSPMGSVFVHLDIAADGRPVSIRIDQAQKFEDTAVGLLLDCVAAGVNRLLEVSREEG